MRLEHLEHLMHLFPCFYRSSVLGSVIHTIGIFELLMDKHNDRFVESDRI